jgi:LuxR family transcriptional regulator, maltose regulon positive regulatory protein
MAPGRMRADAETALAGLSPASPWRTASMVFKGVSDLLEDQADHADAVLAHAIEVGTHAGALPAVSTALAERCLLAIGRYDWAEAETLAQRALATLQAGQLDHYIMSPLVHAVAGRTALHRGDVPGARAHLARAARLRPLLTYAIPWGLVQTLLELGRAYLALDDVAGARAVLRQARDVLRLRPDLGILPAQVEELRSRLDMTREASTGGIVAHHRRVAPAAAPGHPPVVPGDRPATVRVEAHGEDPGGLDLPQARRFLPQPGGPAGTGDRPARAIGPAGRSAFILSG